MKSFNKIIAVAVAIIILSFVALNVIELYAEDITSIKNVEINRAVQSISQTSEIPQTDQFSTITGIYKYNEKSDFFETESDYVVREIDGTLYRIDYYEELDSTNKILYVNIVLAVISLFVLIVLFYIRHSILKPFDRITTLPYELSKGNLTLPVKETKSRYFGKFLWGLDMLREKLEESKQAELELLKDKKTLLLSLSHDIKTPLSAIKLYAKALSSGIYKEPQKQLEVYNSINTKADEIEKLVSEIMRNQTEDIIAFDIKNGESADFIVDYVKVYQYK